MYSSNKNNNRDLLKYAGLAMQLFLALGLAVFLGIKLDTWLKLSFPVLVWVLPLVILVSLMYKLITETNKKK
ncbi:MAG: ATPase F0F1 [Williamsia sp.]|nr:ATPase F0F1 [Williamsia sp.]